MTHAIVGLYLANSRLADMDLDLGMIGVTILMTNMTTANRLEMFFTNVTELYFELIPEYLYCVFVHVADVIPIIAEKDSFAIVMNSTLMIEMEMTNFLKVGI